MGREGWEGKDGRRAKEGSREGGLEMGERWGGGTY